MSVGSIDGEGRVLIVRRRRPAVVADDTLRPELKTFDAWLALLLALATYGKSSIPAALVGLSTDRLSLIQYVLMAVVAGLLAMRSGGIRGVAVLLPAAALVSTLLSAQPMGALPRWAGWALIYAICAPMLIGRGAVRFREQLWKFFIALSVLATLVSLPLYFVPILPKGRGFFSGLMLHSMLMAPIAGVAATALLARYLHTGKKFHFRAFLAALIVVVLCGSRAALLASLFSCGFFMLIADRATRRAVLPVLCLIGLAGGGIYLMRGAVAETEVGNYYFVTKGTRNTRTELWKLRLEEAKAHPWLGVGISMSAVVAASEVDDIGIGSRDMRVEPGSSWIALLSMTGVTGTAAFAMLALSTVRRVRRTRGRVRGLAVDEVRGCLAFFVVHATFEGYIFAVGAPMALVLWLCWGRMDDLHRRPESGE